MPDAEHGDPVGFAHVSSRFPRSWSRSARPRGALPARAATPQATLE
jgi:hypothetical protein